IKLSEAVFAEKVDKIKVVLRQKIFEEIDAFKTDSETIKNLVKSSCEGVNLDKTLSYGERVTLAKIGALPRVREDHFEFLRQHILYTQLEEKCKAENKVEVIPVYMGRSSHGGKIFQLLPKKIVNEFREYTQEEMNALTDSEYSCIYLGIHKMA